MLSSYTLMGSRFTKTKEYYALEFVVQYSKNSANIEDIEATYNYVEHAIRNYRPKGSDSIGMR